MLAQQVAQVIDKVTKGRSGNAIANKSSIITDVDIVTVDFEGRQVCTAMSGPRRGGRFDRPYPCRLRRAPTLVATVSFALLHNRLGLRSAISR